MVYPVKKTFRLNLEKSGRKRTEKIGCRGVVDIGELEQG